MPARRRIADAITGKAPILREPPNHSRVSTSHGALRNDKGRRVNYAPSLKPQEIKKRGYGQGCR